MQILGSALGDFKSVGLGLGAGLCIFGMVLRKGVTWTLKFLTRMLDHSDEGIAKTALWETMVYMQPNQ